MARSRRATPAPPTSAAALTRGRLLIGGLLLLMLLPLLLQNIQPPEPDAAAVLPTAAVTSETAPATSRMDAPAPAAPPDDATQRQWQRDADARMPPMAQYAADCFAQVRVRNPVGRLLALSANRLAHNCAAVVETASGSGRWLFDYRTDGGAFRHYGEVLWPDVWPQAPALPAEAESGAAVRVIADLDPAELDVARIAAVVEQIDIAEDGAGHQHAHWLYEPIWLPEPIDRTVVFVTLMQVADSNARNEHTVYVLAGEEWLEGERRERALSMYPSTRFELTDTHNFKGPLFESTALSESTISLEGAPQELHHPLATLAEGCLAWVRDTAPGDRVLRLALGEGRCWLTLAQSDARERFHVVSYTVDGAHSKDHGALVFSAPPVNLLLDRSRLSASRVREQLGHALRTLQQPAEMRRLAIAWVDGQMVWQFAVNGAGAAAVLYLDSGGRTIDAPRAFPVSVFETQAGFPERGAALPPAG